MVLKDLNNYCIGVPCYKFTPSPHLFQCLQEIGKERQIFVFCSDIRFSRNRIVQEFFSEKYLSSDVLVFCDLDTCCSINQIEAIVRNCSEETPFIGTNMAYRQDPASKNFFLPDDSNGEKRGKILEEIPNAILEVEYAGFGLVALHRSLLEKMINKFGYVNNGGVKSPNLFSELKDYSDKRKEGLLSEELIKLNLLQKAKSKNIEEKEFNEMWEVFGKYIINQVREANKDYILPETFSFCKRARQVNAKLLIMTGVKPGHYSEQVIYSI